MSARRSGLRFFADESLLGVGRVLEAARSDVVHPGHPFVLGIPLGTIDPIWMPIAARMNLVVLSRDYRIRTKPAELALLRAEGLRVLYIAGKQNLSTWGYLGRLVRRWNDIEHLLELRPAGPWFYNVLEDRLTEVRLDREKTTTWLLTSARDPR